MVSDFSLGNLQRTSKVGSWRREAHGRRLAITKGWRAKGSVSVRSSAIFKLTESRSDEFEDKTMSRQILAVEKPFARGVGEASSRGCGQRAARKL